MTNLNGPALRELMEKYDENRRQWIDYHGSDAGFDEWFRMQAMYPIKDTGKNSEHFGPCEICGRHTSDVHHLRDNTKCITSASKFGHKGCLAQFRRKIFMEGRT